jgi:tetratricopeptide (TPR) repeat protein
MSKAQANDDEWHNWIEVQKAAVQAWTSGEGVAAALSIFTGFLATGPPLDLQREAYSLRATLQQERGDLQAAKSDLLAALDRATAPDFVRCELEDSLGFVCFKAGELHEAEAWYLTALRTAAQDPRVAGGGLLLRLLRLRGEKGLSEDEQRAVRKVVYQSWHLLRLEGEPDLAELAATARKLVKAQRGPFSAENPPSPRVYSQP